MSAPAIIAVGFALAAVWAARSRHDLGCLVIVFSMVALIGACSVL